jgi:hypothetical protein
MSQELNNLPADLQLAQVAMQVKPVQALQIERNVPFSTSLTVTGTNRLNRDAMATSGTWLTTKDAPTCTGTPAEPATSAVSGGACLGAR